jgi:hypothetical protein
MDGSLGFAVNDNLSFLIAVNGMVFNTSVPGVLSGEVNLAPTVKYALGETRTKPFWALGLGLNENILQDGGLSVSQSNFMVEAGGGIQVPVEDQIDFYVQAKFTEVFAPFSFSYVPITAGFNFN